MIDFHIDVDTRPIVSNLAGGNRERAMRIGMLAAAGAALFVAAPAQSATYLVNPKTPTITLSQTVTCPTNSLNCTTSDGGAYTPRSFTVDIPQLDGTYNFTGQIGPNVNAGIFSYDATFVFRLGALLSDVVNFTFSSAQVGAQMNRTTTIQGFYENATLTRLDTGAVIAPVPEPAIWAMMVLGFGLVGYGMRRKTDYVSLLRSVSRQ